MTNRNVRLKNRNGDYLYPYTENIPEATRDTAGKIKIDNTPVLSSNNAVTSGAVYSALAQVQSQMETKVSRTELQNYQSNITSLANATGNISFEVNKIYCVIVEENVQFVLPEPQDKTVFNQIKIMLKIVGTPNINWGTEKFFHNKQPSADAGYYDIYYDYDNNMNEWVVGSISKGEVS